MRFDPLGVECIDCHRDKYLAATSPNHVEGGYSTTQPNHQQAGLSTNCASCHKGDYNNTPNTCVGCHQSDYDQTTNPPHASAQFSTDCSLCHTKTVWIPSTFDHDGQYFPIYSGNHNGEWELCSDCHTTPGNYSAFSCIDCHDHNKANMDEEHSDVSDYVYNSIACLDCHPNGSEDFNKTQTKFKIR